MQLTCSLQAPTAGPTHLLIITHQARSGLALSKEGIYFANLLSSTKAATGHLPMTLVLLKYGLPVLLGYTLFVGISGRLNPLAYPQRAQERPSWLLGLWTAFAVCLSANIGLFIAQASATMDVLSLLTTSAMTLAALLIPALLVYAHSQSSRNKAKAAAPPQVTLAVDVDVGVKTEYANEQATHKGAANETMDEQTSVKVSQTDLKTVQIDCLKSTTHSDAIKSDIDEPHPNTQLTEKLAAELALREETEKHLRITRKALSVLEAATRQQTNHEADVVIDLEEKLALSIEKAADNESEAMEQRARRVEAEQDVTDLKHRMVKAKQEIRRNAAARAKALSTANQSIAFARQSVQIRKRLESELSEASTTITNRQKTIASLIKALEKERRKTQSEVGSMARQMVLQEKQLKARRSLEEVARSVENKLTSRLVKKVAKAKPLISDMNQGEAS